LLTQYVTYAALRMFTFCQDLFSEGGEGWIFAWDVAFDYSAALFNPSGKITGTLSRA